MLPDFRVRQRDYLLEISRSITQELDLQPLLTRILDISIEMLAGQAGLIALRSMPGGWTINVSKGISAGFLRQIEPLLAEVPEREEPAADELPEINRLLQRLTRAASLGLLSGVVLPLIARKQVVGVIFIFRNYAAVFSNNDTDLLRSFADQAAIAVHNAKLYSQVSHDKMRLDALLDSVADGIIILNPEHMIEHCNPAFARMVSLPVSQIRGRQHDEIVTLCQPKNDFTLSEAEAGGWPLSSHATLYIEGDLQKQNGLLLPVGITYAPVFSGDGILMNIIASVRDITRFREAEELKSTFISVVSHELKTPVALIKGYVSTLRRDDVAWDREIVDDSLKVIEEEADRLTELIENLLDASRLQAGALAINMTDLSIDQLARRSNAIKYSPSGGEILVSGKIRPDSVVICVSDQGAGIAPGDVPHVFDRFYRSKDASRTTKGAGLGLYLSKAVIEAHGGRIWIEPGIQPGTQLCFSLPREIDRVNSSTRRSK